MNLKVFSQPVSSGPLAHRKAEVTLQIFGSDGSPLADQEIRITQVRHQFLFGTTGFDLLEPSTPYSPTQVEVNERIRAKIEGLFNAITLPFYWGGFETERGKPATQHLRDAAEWCVQRGMRVKGHPLCWHTVTADWLLPLSDAEILAAQLARIDREVRGFAGLIDTWDVINEVVIMPIFDRYDNGITRICKQLGRIDLVRKVFNAARAANPKATLLINDFDMSAAYPILIEGCLEAGIPIDVIGIQSHMHQGYWGVEKTLRILEQFTAFNLPIHFTETNIVSGRLMPPEIVDLNDYIPGDWPTTPEGEERQAEEALTHYALLFDQPLVQGLTWWDFSDGHWLNSPAGLLRKDGSSKPVYDQLVKKIKGEWMTPPLTLRSDQQGQLHFTGFQGDYELSMFAEMIPFHIGA